MVKKKNEQLIEKIAYAQKFNSKMKKTVIGIVFLIIFIIIVSWVYYSSM